MNIKMHRNNFLRRARIFAVLLAGIFLVPALRAQPTEQTVQNRFLFVFDTSRDMKACLEATEKELNTLLATSLSGQLHAGDSVGVWTFSQDLRPGDYPLQNWNPDRAVMIASNLVRFVNNQHYAKSARFEALQPLFNRVVQNSERLTVLIFCYGRTKVSGTPFDSAINQIIGQKQGQQKSEHQPFVIVLRSQLGQYVGGSVDLPSSPVNYPQFPPLPALPPPPKPTNAPPPAPVIAVPPLIIVGTKIESSPSLPQAEPANPPPETKPAPLRVVPPVVPVAPVAPTNASTAPPSNQAVAKVIAPNPASPPASPPDNPDFSNKRFLIIGAGLLGATIVLGIVVRLRLHRKDASLITRSMTDRR
jgi:hypothetical protein